MKRFGRRSSNKPRTAQQCPGCGVSKQPAPQAHKSQHGVSRCRRQTMSPPNARRYNPDSPRRSGPSRTRWDFKPTEPEPRLERIDEYEARPLMSWTSLPVISPYSKPKSTRVEDREWHPPRWLLEHRQERELRKLARSPYAYQSPPSPASTS